MILTIIQVTLILTGRRHSFLVPLLSMITLCRYIANFKIKIVLSLQITIQLSQIKIKFYLICESNLPFTLKEAFLIFL